MEKRFWVKGWPIVLVLLMSLMLVVGCSADSGDGLIVKDVRTLEVAYNPNAVMTTGVFFTIRNAGKQDDALIGATTDVAGRAELHEVVPAMASNGQGEMAGMTQMRKVETVPLPAGESVELRPGGLHVMLFDLKRELVAGDRFQLKLEFKNSAAQTVEVVVVKKTS